MTPLVLCTLVIIVTLAVSGGAKAKEPTSTVTAIVNLKLDQWLPVKPIAKVLPWAEIALALALLVLPGIWQVLAAMSAVVLFAVYWAVIARAIIQGNTASCNCFGSASSAPVSMFTLIRNTALLMATFGALIGAFSSGKSALGLLLTTDPQGWLWLIGAGLASLTLWAIYRAELVGVAELTEKLEATPLAVKNEELVEADYQRMPIPFAALYYPANKDEEQGERTTLRDLASQQARILMWVSSGCSHCHEAIGRMEEWQEHLPMLGIHPVVFNDAEIKNFTLGDRVQFLIDSGFETLNLFGDGTPAALALGTDGLLAGGPVFGANDVVEFVEAIIEEINGHSTGQVEEATVQSQEDE